jgi:hypothetical protein
MRSHRSRYFYYLSVWNILIPKNVCTGVWTDLQLKLPDITSLSIMVIMEIYRRLNWFQWFLVGAFILLFAGTFGLVWGYITGTRAREVDAAVSNAVEIQTQFELGLGDYTDGRYSLAKQRFEYVLKEEPGFPGAAQYLAETLLRMDESGIQITEVILPTATLSPTPDTRAIDELYATALNHLTGKDWGTLVQTILALRNIDPSYRVVEIDRMLYLGLRFGGIQKILEEGDLEGGLYDLALAKQFTPLDYQAGIYTEWARLYQVGISFLGVLPERAVYYFSQLAAAAPYLHDASGIPAQNRYRMALLQYGDQLANAEDWCEAFEQYNLAASLGGVSGLQSTITSVDEKCQYSIATPTLTASATLEQTATITVAITTTPTITPSISLTETPTATTDYTSTPTGTATATATATLESADTATPTASPTATQAPLETPTATATATPTAPATPTPTPSPTEE